MVLTSFLQRDGVPFSKVLPEEHIARVFEEANATFAQDEVNPVYTPAITLWAFLSQVLFKGEQRSCAAAVARVIVLLAALGRKPCSENTGAYCRARAKIPTEVVRRLTTDVADAAEKLVPDEWLWNGRHVKLVDGFTVSMPDTEANQAEYPQSKSQKAGVGFPLARCVVLLSLATGMVGDLEIGPYSGKETGETALLRNLLHRLRYGDILLGDRYYCSYFLIAILKSLGIDFVVRLHQCRTANFRRGRRLGAGDHIVEWVRPQQPSWMDDATYATIPKSIQVREVEVNISYRGCRSRTLVVVTTLLDDTRYPRGEISALYEKRWMAELDIRAIKSTLGFDVLRCTWPEMVRTELWVALLEYNLIRRTMLDAAMEAEVPPRRLSFAHALQMTAASWIVVLTAGDRSGAITAAVIQGMQRPLVGRRPHRVEPRAIKRRPKPHDFLNKPRDEARKELLFAHG
ncbi:MAG: IS4 family transposase [Planctomycetota bacterium]|nr:IS4 family transposase [Planctomycetota bacterium]